ncbi:MAG: signal peptide peptidase SppA [Alphaproteobacteria bacterium]
MAKNFKSRPLFARHDGDAVKKKNPFDVDWVVLPMLWGWVKRVAMGLGFLVLFQALVLVLILPSLLKGGSAPALPDEMVLYMNIDAPIAEVAAAASFSDPFAGHDLLLREYVDALHAAADDARVKGLVVRLRNAPVTLSQSQELHKAIARVKEAGKFTAVYSTSYGEGGGGLGRYYFASVFDEIWMMPLGVLDISGVNAEVPYFRAVLDKIGVEPQFFQRKDYKTAYESVTNREMSVAQRETFERLIGDLRGEIEGSVSRNRGISVEALTALVDQGFLSADDARAAGLITHADYADVLIEDIKERVTGSRDAEDDLFVSLSAYAVQVEDEASSEGEIAVIYAVGAIMPSDEGGAPLGTSGIAAADEIAPAILDAADDDAVEAIVLRVDSPGGSPSASESILRAVRKAQAKGKKVVVSMGATAASGGYWISAYADEIFVLPTTVTGSIGVVGGKFSLARLWQDLGLKWERISWGENSGMMSMNSPFSKSEAKQFNAMLDDIYDAFIVRVADGRNMSPDAVEAVAGGRVWTGVRAVENGLADQIGGLEDAIDYTAREIGYSGADDVAVRVYPAPKSPLEQLMLLLEGQVAIGEFMRGNAHVFEAFAPLSRAVWEAKHSQDLGVYRGLPVVQ